MEKGNNKNDCPCDTHGLRIDNLEKAIQELKSIFSTLNSLTMHIERIAIETQRTREDFNDLSCRVKDIESKPGKRYETIVMYIITGLIGISLGALAVSMGLK